jgi:dihydroorotase
VNPAKALHREGDLGAIAVGRVADISILDVVNGKWKFLDSQENPFTGEQAIVPVHTIRRRRHGNHRRRGSGR